MDKWDTAYASGEGLRWWPETELARFIGRVYGSTHGLAVGLGNSDPMGKALDLGCGTGRNSWLLRESGFAVEMMDASQEALGVALDYLLCERQCVGIGHSVAALPDGLTRFKDNSFDLVVDCQTIQHLGRTDHFYVYDRIARILKPDGRLWTMHWAAGDADLLYEHRYPELHEWKLNVLADMMMMSGLVCKGVEAVERHVWPSFPDTTSAIDAMWYCMDWVKP